MRKNVLFLLLVSFFMVSCEKESVELALKGQNGIGQATSYTDSPNIIQMLKDKVYASNCENDPDNPGSQKSWLKLSADPVPKIETISYYYYDYDCNEGYGFSSYNNDTLFLTSIELLNTNFYSIYYGIYSNDYDYNEEHLYLSYNPAIPNELSIYSKEDGFDFFLESTNPDDFPEITAPPV